MDDALVRGAKHAEAAIAPLIAMGLFNTLVYAKAEEDLKRRDALLGELRDLAATHPEDATVRKSLAMALDDT